MRNERAFTPPVPSGRGPPLRATAPKLTRPSPEAAGAVAARVAGAERPLGGEERALCAALLQEVKGSMLPGLDETAEHVL